MNRPARDSSLTQLTDVEWEVLYLLYDGLNQLRKLTLSFSEIRYVAVERTEDEIRRAIEGLRHAGGPGDRFPAPLVVPVPNLTNLPIYHIAPLGRKLVQQAQGAARP